MAGYAIRSLVDLSRAARGYFTQSIAGAIASVWANTFTVFAKVLALIGFELELRRKWLFDQMFASSADEVWLRRHGFELGLAPGAPLKAIGTVLVPAPSGTLVPAGLSLTRPDGVGYTTLTAEVATGAGVRLAIQADEAGSVGNCPAGTGLVLAVSGLDLPGLGTQAVVADAGDGSGLAGGADAEALETFRARVLRRKRRPPQGGAAPDYETWVGEALGEDVVDRVFVDSFANDARSVWVAFTVTTTPDGLPTDAQIAVAQAYLDDPVRRPVTARVFAVKMTALPIPVLIGRLTPDSVDVRASVEAELAAEFVDRVEPSTPSTPTSLSRSWLSEAIGRAVGEERNLLLQPAGDVDLPVGFWPVLGPVLYTD